MNVDKKTLPKSQIELKITVPAKDVEAQLDNAAKNYSKDMKIAGFRPGKAPKDIVQKQVGELKLWEEAIRLVLPKAYVEALENEKVEAIGQPEIHLDKVAPGNELTFKAVVSVMPELKLPDYKKIKCDKKEVKVDEKVMSESLEHLQKSRAKFAKVTRAAEKGDSVEINFKTFMNKVPIDKGESKNHPIIIGDNMFVHGFEDNLIGMKEGDKKEFGVKFPKDYHAKNMADKDVEFEVEMLMVQSRELPKLDDEFAKGLGDFKGIDDLKAKIKENLMKEAEDKEKQRLEMEIMKKISEKTEADLPELLINAEKDKMIHEMKDSVQAQGGEFDKYLESIKKTEEQLREEFADRADKRVLYGLILREIAKVEKIEASDKDLKEETDNTFKQYAHDKDMQKRIDSDDYRDYARGLIVNRKVFELLKKECAVAKKA